MARNPSTGASAVVRLLERPSTPEDLRAATARVARDEHGQGGADAGVFVFRLGAEWLGLSTSLVDEVLDPRPVHSLPHRGDTTVRGVVNVGGQLTVCVALQALLQTGVEAAARSRLLGHRLVVLATREGRLAFEADEVHGGHRYDSAVVMPVPSTLSQSVARFATGVLPWGERHVGLLDEELLLHALHRRLS